MRVTPTNNTLVAFGAVNASSAPLLICISPLAKPSEWAIHFFTLLTGFEAGMKRVQTVSLSIAVLSSSTKEVWSDIILFAVGDDNRNTFVRHFLGDMTFRQHTSPSKG